MADGSFSASTPKDVLLADYKPFAYSCEALSLEFHLEPSKTRVIARSKWIKKTGETGNFFLNGENLKLLKIEVDGEVLSAQGFAVDDKGLTLNAPAEAFELLTEVEIAPDKNTALSGLYMSGGRFCTQCESEGFRRITYFPDRPDVLTVFDVYMEADKAHYPILLSNGNPGETGEISGGRHFARWHDPHRKPAYLFALVAGELDHIKDDFTTMAGKSVELTIYVDPGEAHLALYAMDALKRSMKWDEDVFGREYDLDVFNIVAVRDFNFGAMENKGLNIFNSSVLLADEETATDDDFERIESVVAHEYFHNWTGNRITCRDWFQLCLKEGLTVYRDQEFSADMRDRDVQRIKDVIRLRARQFPEDQSPLAHSVRPSSYKEIDNLYTATVYEKGAELIRMLKVLIGEDAFFEGMNLYFNRHDGEAVTIEDFYACFEEASGKNLEQFRLWYSQAGTPELIISEISNNDNVVTRIKFSQSQKATPGQTDGKAPLAIPVRYQQPGQNTYKLHILTEAEEEVELETKPDRTSSGLEYNHGFGAPILINDNLTHEERLARLNHYHDGFNQWDGLQRVLSHEILKQAEATSSGVSIDDHPPTEIFKAVETAFTENLSKPAFAALLLQIPTVSALMQQTQKADPSALHIARENVREGLASHLHDRLASIATEETKEAFAPSAEQAGKRALKNASLGLLSALGALQDGLFYGAFSRATNMTDTMGALMALSASNGPSFDTALNDFYDKWKQTPLVMDKWFMLQAIAPRPDAHDRVKSLRKHPDFDIKNPNRARSLLMGFASQNLPYFHALSGEGYDFIIEGVKTLDGLNPSMAAGLLTAFSARPTLETRRKNLMTQKLEALRQGQQNLSKNTRDILGRLLSD